MSTTGIPHIRYVSDYEVGALVDRKRFQINHAGGGGRSELYVAFASGRSTEFLIREVYDKLDDVREAYQMAGNPWNGSRRFYELKHVLIDVARQNYDEIVAQDYPNQADKTDANYEELRRKIITAMSDHILPGNKVRDYLTQHIKYLKCKMNDGSGRVEKPVRVLARMNLIKRMASSMLHHDHGAVYISNDDMTRAFWRIFPTKMHDWLTNEQNINPVDVNNPMDAMEIADQFQRYWNLHFKNETKKEGENDQGGRRKDRDGDDNDNGNKRRKGGRKYSRGGGRGNNNDRTNEGNDSGGNCAIDGHQKYRHNWQGCFLNPYCRHFDANEARNFFNEKAHGPNAFYKDVYKNRPQANGGGNYNGGGRGPQGRGGGGRGRGNGPGHQGGRGYQGGRNYQGGRGGGRGGYQNQGYQNQGYQQGNNYNNNNNQQQGYHYDNNYYNGPGGGNQQGPPTGRVTGRGGHQPLPQNGGQPMDGYHFDYPQQEPSVNDRSRQTRYLGTRGYNSTTFNGW